MPCRPIAVAPLNVCVYVCVWLELARPRVPRSCAHANNSIAQLVTFRPYVANCLQIFGKSTSLPINANKSAGCAPIMRIASASIYTYISWLNSPKMTDVGFGCCRCDTLAACAHNAIGVCIWSGKREHCRDAKFRKPTATECSSRRATYISNAALTHTHTYIKWFVVIGDDVAGTQIANACTAVTAAA